MKKTKKKSEEKNDMYDISSLNTNTEVSDSNQKVILLNIRD